MKIAMLQTVTPQIADYTKYVTGINSQYCIENGYDYIIEHNTLGSSRHPSWNRIQVIGNALTTDRYDYVFMLDADAIVQNSSFKLEDIIAKAPNAFLLICDDIPNGGFINCGAMLLKKGLMTMQFLNRWWQEGERLNFQHVFPYEQQTLWEILKQDSLLLDSDIKIFPIDEFNSHWMSIPEDNFIAHFMARSNEDKIKALKPLWQKLTENY